MRRVSGPAAILCAAIVLVAPASARPSAADFQLFVTAGSARPAPVIPNNGTANIAGLAFRAGAIVDNNGGEEATASIRFVLAEGLRFGSDLPDSSESCTTDGRTAQCQTPLLIGTEPTRRTGGWDWDVIADGPGSYVLRAEITQTSVVDPDITSNTASATVVVSVPTAPNPAAVSASSVKLAPAKPKAGATVSASVRLTAGGAAVRPSRVTCTGSIASLKIKGTARAAAGSATCRYLPPRSAKGKTLRGTVAFTARGERFTKRFSAKLS